ncbi:MAG: DUF2007 domain-containing protein [Bacteroidetes bacterium]|nr:DUF2007 domain-containing protein [Bacteroidota bacterium]HET6243973.1 DUF2007 domain-containing protein [Bacteroidia bacterium]
MEKEWVKIYQTDDIHKTELIKAVLKKNDIQSVSLNKKDSSYLSFGEIELYVNTADVLKAMQLLKDF